MKKILLSIVFVFALAVLQGQIKTFRMGTGSPSDTTQQILYSVSNGAIIKIGLVSPPDTAWFRWDGSVLNFMADTVKVNGKTIEGANLGNYSFSGNTIFLNGKIFPAARFHVVNTQLEMLADRKSTRLNSSHIPLSRMPSSA